MQYLNMLSVEEKAQQKPPKSGSQEWTGKQVVTSDTRLVFLPSSEYDLLIANSFSL